MSPVGAARVARNSLGGVIPDSGVSRWTFDDSDTQTGTALDSWGDNDASINGATTGVSGANQTYTTDEAYDFDGANDYVEVPHDPSLDISPDSLTLTAWVDLSDVSSYNEIFHKDTTGRSDDDEGIVRFYVNSGTLQTHIGQGGTDTEGSANTSLSTNQDYFVGLVLDNGTAKFYLDGSPDGSISYTSGLNPDTSEGWRIGVHTNSDGSLNNFTDGVIDDPRVFNKALTDTEMSNLYNTGSISG